MPGTGNAGNGGTADHDNVMMIGHVNDDPLLEDRAISLPLWGDMAGGENGSNEGNGTGAVTGKSFSYYLIILLLNCQAMIQDLDHPVLL